MKTLPIELINKILIFRPRHPVATVIMPFINAYRKYVDIYDLSFIDVDYDFRFFTKIVIQYDFMASVECKEFQSHFNKKYERVMKKFPFSTIDSLHIFERL